MNNAIFAYGKKCNTIPTPLNYMFGAGTVIWSTGNSVNQKRSLLLIEAYEEAMRSPEEGPIFRVCYDRYPDVFPQEDLGLTAEQGFQMFPTREALQQIFDLALTDFSDNNKQSFDWAIGKATRAIAASARSKTIRVQEHADKLQAVA